MTQFVFLMQQLRTTFDSGVTRNIEWRQRQLKQLAALLKDHENELLEALQLDLGKSHAEGWLTELSVVNKEIQHTLNHLPQWMKAKRVRQPFLAMPGKSYLHPEPLGIVLIIGAWNYPIQLMLSPLIAALAAGNCVILKPSELAPRTAELLANTIPQYLAHDAINVVNGGADIVTDLLQNRFDHILYTGSERVGKIVMRAAAEYLTPVTLELGGKSPAVILADANIKTTARRLAWGKWINAGQTCIAPDYVLVDESIQNELVAALKEASQTMFGVTPQSAEDYGRIVNDAHFNRLISYLNNGKVAFGGDFNASERYLAPTVLTHVNIDSPIMRDEIFGPILPIIPISSLTEAIDFIQQREKPLALYGFSNSNKKLRQLTEATSAGNQCNNDTLMFMLNPELPFGGVGRSGMGRYHGYFGFETFSHVKAVMYRSTRPDPSFRYPPYTKFKRRIMRWLSSQ